MRQSLWDIRFLMENKKDWTLIQYDKDTWECTVVEIDPNIEQRSLNDEKLKIGHFLRPNQDLDYLFKCHCENGWDDF